MPCGPAVAFQGPRHLCQAPSGLRVRAFGTCAPRWPRGWGLGGGPRHALSPCLLALRHGGKRVRALGTCAIHPLLNFREDDRLLVRLSVHALVGVRGEGDGGLGVLCCCVGLHVLGKVKCRKHLVHPRYTSGSAWKSCSASSEILSGPGLQPHPTVTPSVSSRCML